MPTIITATTYAHPHQRMANMDNHPATWRMFRRSLSKAGHIAERDHCLDLSIEAMRVHCRAYDEAAAQYGTGGVLVSGGTHSTWPREVMDRVGGLRRAASQWNQHALDHHRAAGFRAHTFPGK